MTIQAEIKKLQSKSRSTTLQKFFKTGPGEYAEGDIFLGLTVGQSRGIAKKFKDLTLKVLAPLMTSKIHEERLIALVILCERFPKAPETEKSKIFNFLIKYRKGINNWDLVDTVAPAVFGPYLFQRDRQILFKYAKSEKLWEKRIAIMSTFYFLRQHDFTDTLKIATLLMHDEHDLIHKAVGWMLREVGKRDINIEKKFLNKYATQMPRTMLRYAIEKFPETERKAYLAKK
ncbi:DNA alkylation repair protein [Bdellovibrio sp. SKB1291214]|uniref:DNA alkylation repair protein n=1 Tax=Bdellovibrio sp. SKB1291214 TaxID=1732569 RepID=UPI000B51B244|nr:DNA alkylation repair protein [Bdellovibrio sp. SKB1291214]UYL08395.1 DNA alkylation repair protein [Bdellovibrio sp. SKB1291214]